MPSGTALRLPLRACRGLGVRPVANEYAFAGQRKLKDNLLQEKAILLLQEVQHRVAEQTEIFASVLMQNARRWKWAGRGDSGRHVVDRREAHKAQLGAAAMTLAGTNYAIHGTNAPASIGGFVSYDCIRTYNEDIEDLIARVEVVTTVVVRQ